ncbi:MAG: exodeoxyribonuclease VII large subunit [Prevotella sp.]|nr:exodeoxyribonuclease VII large subunit [Prevotella sp.]
MEHALTLYELNSMVRMTLEADLPDEYWVEAELSEAREVRGHCYMELVQKDGRSNVLVAKASAKCWKNKWLLIRRHFETVTGQTFRPGLKVMLRVYADFHEAYGFSWIVTDIDPTFTMGDMARKRMEIIRQLKEEGVFDLQHELELPLFAQRIAVISSEQAAGYGDFCNQLANNGAGFVFYPKLFPAVMQGEAVSDSVIAALDRINRNADDFDAVVIIRGGGATSDLSGFDTLELAENVANFPIPIITGIGHDRDESVLDLVAHTRVKTPTAAAGFLIDHLSLVHQRIQDAQDEIVGYVSHRMDLEKLRLGHLSADIPRLFSLHRVRQGSRLDHLFSDLCLRMRQRLHDAGGRLATFGSDFRQLSGRRIVNERHRIELLEQRARALDPSLLLCRGYSITLKDGHAVHDPKALKPGDEIETRYERGSTLSIIKEVK